MSGEERKTARGGARDSEGRSPMQGGEELNTARGRAKYIEWRSERQRLDELEAEEQTSGMKSSGRKRETMRWMESRGTDARQRCVKPPWCRFAFPASVSLSMRVCPVLLFPTSDSLSSSSVCVGSLHVRVRSMWMVRARVCVCVCMHVYAMPGVYACMNACLYRMRVYHCANVCLCAHALSACAPALAGLAPRNAMAMSLMPPLTCMRMEPCSRILRLLADTSGWRICSRQRATEKEGERGQEGSWCVRFVMTQMKVDTQQHEYPVDETVQDESASA